MARKKDGPGLASHELGMHSFPVASAKDALLQLIFIVFTDLEEIAGWKVDSLTTMCPT